MATSSVSEIADELKRLLGAQDQVEEIRAQVLAVAEEAADYARSIAPVDSGDFVESIRVEPIPDRNGLPAFEVVSDDPSAPYIEYGTKDTPEFGVFAKTAQHFNEVRR